MKLLPAFLSFASLALSTSIAMANPILNLDAQAHTEVKQDTVVITLQATMQSSEQAVVTKTLSETVSTVLEELKKQNTVKVSSGNYFVRPQQNKDGDITAWQGQSELILKSTAMAEAAELAAQYQDKMPVANVAFTVSRQARQEAEQLLMNEVVAAFNQRAQTMVSALNYADFKIKDMQLGGNAPIYPRSVAYRAASPMMKADAAPIPLESGSEEITLSLSGSIYLLDEK